MIPQSSKADACPVCVSARVQLLKSNRGYSLARCRDCGLLWDSKFDHEPVALYDQKYFIGGNPERGYADYSSAMEVNRLTFRRRLKVVEGLAGTKGRVLDVGCALGDFLVEARKMGWQNPTGLDVSGYAVETCRSRALETTQGTLSSAAFAAETFDAIFLQDVIEHTLDPVAQLKQVFALLKPGGIVFITTPNCKSLSARVLGKRWYHYKPGEHLVYFSHKSIRLLLDRAGFESSRSRTTFSTMGMGYILDRMVTYQPLLFRALGKICKLFGLSRIPVTLPIGEMEAWAYKPRAALNTNVIPIRRKSTRN
jgi:SAM-dependent methyltransferase